MAINPSFSDAPVLAKVKIGDSTYFIKDAELRRIVSAFGNATEQDVAVSIGESATGLTLASDVYAFVMSQIGTLGQVITLLSESDHTEVLTPNKGDFVIEADGKEWLYDGTAWREVGSENAYVLKSFEIAGIAMSGSEITASQLSSALSLDALAFKASASQTLNDYPVGISAASYTPEGNITLPAPTTSAFAVAGVTATVGSGDDSETLIFSAATTASAVTEIDVSGASFIGSAASIAPTLDVSNKTIEVS